MTARVESPTTRTRLDAVVCLDGSRRSAEALRPALAQATRRNESVSVLALGGGARDEYVREHVAAVGLDPSQINWVASKRDMLAHLVREAEQGATPVLSAFGRWGTTGDLSGILGELIRSDVARVLAVGPCLTSTAVTGGAMVIATDGVHRVDPLIEATESFIDESTTRVLLAHVVSPGERGPSYTTIRDAEKARLRLGVPVEPSAIISPHVGTAIASLASVERATLVVARSWHRWSSRHPESASSSLAIVAEAPCPVLIVN